MQPHGTGQCQCTRFPSNGVQVALGKIQLLPGIAKLPRGIASVRRLWAQRIETVGGKLMLIFTSNPRGHGRLSLTIDQFRVARCVNAGSGDVITIGTCHHWSHSGFETVRTAALSVL